MSILENEVAVVSKVSNDTPHGRIFNTVYDLIESLKLTKELTQSNVRGYMLHYMTPMMLYVSKEVTLNNTQFMDSMDKLGLVILYNKFTKQITITFGDVTDPYETDPNRFVVDIPVNYNNSYAHKCIKRKLAA